MLSPKIELFMTKTALHLKRKNPNKEKIPYKEYKR
jgi:hypothetical protein